MKEVLDRIENYKLRADMFMLPLTGLKKESEYEVHTYLFWREYNIDDYKLILCYHYDDINKFTEFCKRDVFPILDRKGYLLESYDVQGRGIFVLDISEWGMDIQMFLLGKFSKFSNEAKQKIRDFHIEKGKISAKIHGILYPTEQLATLDGKSFMEYIAINYELDLATLKELGETGTIYDKKSETLVTEVEELCKTAIEIW